MTGSSRRKRRKPPDPRTFAEVMGVDLGESHLLREALTHKSYANEHPDEGRHNERLEFLGDAVVDLAVGAILMEANPSASEGELSQMRAVLVDERGLANVARSLDLGRWLRVGRGEELSGGKQKSSLLADAYEAVAGAVFLVHGFPTVLEMIRRQFAEAVADAAQRAGQDFKTVLQESFQADHRELPVYEIVAESGPDHDKQFTVEVRSADRILGAGRGRNKKVAEQAAARDALESMKEE